MNEPLKWHSRVLAALGSSQNQISSMSWCCQAWYSLSLISSIRSLRCGSIITFLYCIYEYLFEYCILNSFPFELALVAHLSHPFSMTCSQTIHPAIWFALTSPLGFQVAHPACHSAFPLPSFRMFSLRVLSYCSCTWQQRNFINIHCTVKFHANYWCLALSAIMSTAHVLNIRVLYSPITNFSNHITRIVMYM